MRGRKIGYTEVTVEDIQIIVQMTLKGFNRTEIANAVHRSKKTVYLYQKRFCGSKL